MQNEVHRSEKSEQGDEVHRRRLRCL